MNEPSARDQLEFLTNLQRLLSEGMFTATYKYGLLLALADLSVICGTDTNAMLLLDLRDIADKFIQYYWSHAVPFTTTNQKQNRILFQNSNPLKEAAILSILQELRVVSNGSIVKARANKPAWRSAISKVAHLIEVMPLWKLQTMGDREFCFLYENNWVEERRGIIGLNPGVAYNFRRFYPLIHSLVKDAWVMYIRKLSANQSILGQTNDLHEFLFGSERQNLARLIPILSPIQNEACFYCAKRMVGEGEVDHFIPWSRYSVDLAHNFVLAHSSCNCSKSDFLAATPHLERWLKRNVDHRDYLQKGFDGQRIPHDVVASIRVTHWAYEQAQLSQAFVWYRSKELSPLQSDWKLLFNVE